MSWLGKEENNKLDMVLFYFPRAILQKKCIQINWFYKVQRKDKPWQFVKGSCLKVAGWIYLLFFMATKTFNHFWHVINYICFIKWLFAVSLVIKAIMAHILEVYKVIDKYYHRSPIISLLPTWSNIFCCINFWILALMQGITV